MAKSKKPTRGPVKKQVVGPVAEPATAHPGVSFRKSFLPGGVRVLTESHPVSRAVSCGIWVNRGTRHEADHEAGLAHFIEHMVFKRTKKRSAFEISRDMEAVGGELNAFTSREYTCYVTHSLKEHVGLSLDVLSDLVSGPTFDKADIRKEKKVVIQEIHMAEEQLEDNIFDRYFANAYGGQKLAKPILGSLESINGMKRETLVDFHSRLYTDANIIVSVAGHVDHDEVVKLVKKHLKLTGGRVRKNSPRDQSEPTPELHAFRDAVKKPAEQAHLLVGIPASSFRDKLRFEAYIVNSILGGGMTSRLYQSVREDRGLAYAIYSQLVTFVDSGMLLVYAGTEPKAAPEVIELMVKEIRRLKRDGMKRSDLEFFKTQVKGQILLGADDIENRMNSLAVNEMVFGRYRSVDDVMRDVEGVTLDSVHEYIELFFDLDRLGIMVLGNVPEAPMKRWLESV